MTTRCIHLSLPLLLVGALAVLTAGCATRAQRMEEPTAPVEWRLTEDAASTYTYLVFQDARRSRDWETARQAMQELLQLEPAPSIYAEAANFYWRRDSLIRAREVLKQGLDSNPQSHTLAMLLAQTYLADERPGDAVLTLQSFLESNATTPYERGNIQARQELADLLVQQDRPAEALDTLNEIPESERGPATRFFMAKALAGMGRQDQAIDALRAAVEEDPDFVEAWAELAYQHELQKDYVAAEQIYSHLLEMGQDSQELWLRLIDLNLKLNNPDRALSLTEQGPDSLSFRLAAGTLFIDNAFYEHARTVLQPLAKRKPAPPEVNFYLALLEYEGYGNLERAIELLRQVPEDNPHYDRSLRFRAHLLFESGQEHKALELAQQGRERFPEEREFWLLEARLHQDRKEFDQALGVLQEARARWPEDAEILYLSGVVLERAGKREQAMDVMEKVVSQNPEHADALNFLGYTLAEAERDLDRAMVLVKNALRLKPDNGYILDSLAWVHFKKGDLQTAWETIQQAVAKVDSDPTIWEHYGDIARALDLRKEAVKGYRKALEHGSDERSRVEEKLRAL
jgi:tetratricopeptide (TPR) repeat protein